MFVELNAAGGGHEVLPHSFSGCSPPSVCPQQLSRKVLTLQHLELKAAACPPSSSQATVSLAEK